jgi:uncharacterized protein YegJ (DUF2314 family)|tara:strand:+ start:1347 stop:1718 length:372 start_codon:yes stop_codon:yes gene_type:complete
MIKEGEVKKLIEEAEDNIVYTCEEHGASLYLHVKNNPDVPKNYIYCYFPIDTKISIKSNLKVLEKMWVKIIKGDRNKGFGLVWNEPKHNTNYKLHDLVEYVTDDGDITRVIYNLQGRENEKSI